MSLCRLTILAAAWSLASMATAQPAQPNGRDSNRPPQPQPQMVLAAAAQQVAETPAPAPEAQPAQTPPKRPRAARVTTCRCGDSGQ